MAVYVRYCPECGQEYQPHMTECVDCGRALVEKLEGAVPDPNPTLETEPGLPPGHYGVVADSLSATTLDPVVQQLVAAGIPTKVEAYAYGLRLSCRAEDRPAVAAILEREGVIPTQPDAAAPAVTAEGGLCPACGTYVPPGAVDCPDCGLQLGGARCRKCGEDLDADDEVCPVCGSQDLR